MPYTYTNLLERAWKFLFSVSQKLFCLSLFVGRTIRSLRIRPFKPWIVFVVEEPSFHKPLFSDESQFFAISVFFFFSYYHTTHLYYVRRIDGVASIIFFSFFTTWRRQITQFLVSGSILILPPYAEREKKPSEYCNFFLHFCRRQESNPGRQLSKQVRYPLQHCPSAKTQF